VVIAAIEQSYFYRSVFQLVRSAQAPETTAKDYDSMPVFHTLKSLFYWMR
jgi:hypothetical protein